MNPDWLRRKTRGRDRSTEFLSRLIGVFSPGETFAGMAPAPRALVPIIVVFDAVLRN